MIKTALFFKKKKEETEETEEEKKKREDDNKHSAKRTMLKSLKYHALGGAVSAGLGYYSAKKSEHDPENFNRVKEYYKNKHKHNVEYDENSLKIEEMLPKKLKNNKHIYNAAKTMGKVVHYGGINNGKNKNDNSGQISHSSEHLDPTMLAHEHGHIHAKGRIFRGDFARPANLSSKIVGAGITAKMSNSKNKWIRRAGVALPLLSTIPHLHEEARASIHAKRGLNELGIKKDVNKKLLSAHGAYSARSLIPAAASTYMNYKIKKRRERLMKEEQEKNEQAR